MNNMLEIYSPFIVSKETGKLIENSDIYFVRCYYDKKHYHRILFEQYNLYFPPAFNNAVVKRQSEHFAGRYCARSVLLMLGIKGGSVGIGTNREPIWPKKIKGSISHTDSSAICIASESILIKGLGVDQEYILSASLIEEISNQIVNKQELLLLNSTEMDYKIAFTIAFSGKESFFKAMFPLFGDYFSFDAVTLIQLTNKLGKGEFCLMLNKHFSNEFTHGKKVYGYFMIQREIVETYVILE